MKYYVDRTMEEFVGLIDLNLCILITDGKSYGVNLKYMIEIQTIQTTNSTWIICFPQEMIIHPQNQWHRNKNQNWYIHIKQIHQLELVEIYLHHQDGYRT